VICDLPFEILFFVTSPFPLLLYPRRLPFVFPHRESAWLSKDPRLRRPISFGPWKRESLSLTWCPNYRPDFSSLMERDCFPPPGAPWRPAPFFPSPLFSSMPEAPPVRSSPPFLRPDRLTFPLFIREIFPCVTGFPSVAARTYRLTLFFLFSVASPNEKFERFL